ncbi:hypothetical protein Tco_0414791 [Tanacetum coccineum]
MSSPSAYTAPETTTPIDRSRDTSVITPFHDDPYVLVRQAYTPIATDIESEPFEETQPLSPRAAPLSPDYTSASLYYTSDTLHSDGESEPMEASETRTASPSDSTSPLSPDHPLTQTSPTPIPFRAFYYHRIARMVRYIPSCETPTLSSLPPVMLPTLPPQKRYRGTSELITDTNTKSEDLEDEGTDSKSEEAASEDQQPTISVKGTTADEPLGLGYGAARRRALELAEDTSRNTFKVRQSSKSVPEQADHTPRLPARPTWVDPKDASLIVPSLVPSLVTTPAATIAVDEDEFLKVGAQLQLNGSILHDHTLRLDALPPTLIKGFGWDITELVDSALWQPVLALEAWARQSDAQREDMWQARYEDHRLIHDLLVQNTTTQRELQELRDRVTALGQERSHRGE